MKVSKVRAHHNSILELMIGHWCALLGFAIPAIYQAVRCLGYPIDCPIHGPGKYFKMHRDGNDTGGGGCPLCGDCPDGISVLMHFNNWTYVEAVEFIEKWLERYENAVKTGYPDVIMDERFTGIPLPPYVPVRANRFTQAREEKAKAEAAKVKALVVAEEPVVAVTADEVEEPAEVKTVIKKRKKFLEK